MQRPSAVSALAVLVLLVGVSAGAQVPSPPAKKVASPTEIDQLIKQLGSKQFKERQAAARELEAIGYPALAALRRTASQTSDLEIRRRTEQLVQRIKNGLDALLAAYRGHGLPLPPKTAKLVRYEAGGGGIVNRKVQPIEYGLAFEIEPATKSAGPHLLVGTMQRRNYWPPHTREVAPEPDAVKDLLVGSEDGLALAIQCHARGWEKLAKYLLERSRKEAEAPPQAQLVQMAWVYWEGHLTKPKIDRAPVAKRLKVLLRQDKKLNTKSNRALLKSLELALVPSKAKPGSVEALIDALVDYNANTGTIGPYEPEDHYWRIALRGFEAVPTLIEHLDDDRLTRAMMVGFNNFRSWHLRVGDVVGDLLEGLAGQGVGRDWLRRQQGYRVQKAEAKKWWGKARKVGEEAYLLANVLPTDDKATFPSEHMLKLIAAKYPRHVPSLYRTLLEKRPELESWPLAKAVMRCKMPAKEKLDLFLQGARHKNKKHRLPALGALADLDKKQFNELLIATIESTPKDVTGEYWICPEAHVARLAMASDDPKVWTVLERVAKRSSLGLRMELLNNFGDPTDTRHRRERLRLLACFLDDATLRDEDTSKKFGGPGAGFPYHKIEVRDFVAREIARLVGIKVELNLERTPEEWAKIRAKVREALKRELDKGLSDAPSRPGRQPERK